MKKLTINGFKFYPFENLDEAKKEIVSLQEILQKKLFLVKIKNSQTNDYLILAKERQFVRVYDKDSSFLFFNSSMKTLSIEEYFEILEEKIAA